MSSTSWVSSRLYTNSAFEWSNQQPSAEYSDLLAKLNDMVKLPPKQLVAKWKQDYPLDSVRPPTVIDIGYSQ